jgi:outer membrane lipoprotein-sorting protein
MNRAAISVVLLSIVGCITVAGCAETKDPDEVLQARLKGLEMMSLSQMASPQQADTSGNQETSNELENSGNQKAEASDPTGVH